MYSAVVTISYAYKWAPETYGKLYIEDDSTEGLYFWERRAKEYLEAIKKSGNTGI